jgi:hypothetical protein
MSRDLSFITRGRSLPPQRYSLAAFPMGRVTPLNPSSHQAEIYKPLINQLSGERLHIGCRTKEEEQPTAYIARANKVRFAGFRHRVHILCVSGWGKWLVYMI